MSTSTDRLRKSASKVVRQETQARTKRTLRLEQLEPRLPLAGFTVTSFQDSGLGSLRDAIGQANVSPGPDNITFAKKGAIKLLSGLPAITDDVTINVTAPKK